MGMQFVAHNIEVAESPGLSVHFLHITQNRQVITNIGSPRGDLISTCFLYEDYFSQSGGTDKIFFKKNIVFFAFSLFIQSEKYILPRDFYLGIYYNEILRHIYYHFSTCFYIIIENFIFHCLHLVGQY